MLLSLLSTASLLAETSQESNVSKPKSSDIPSRLEEGYGSDELLSETMPYIPDVTTQERIKFYGDLRLRSQSIVSEDANKPGQENVFRYRARIGMDAAINDQTKFEFVLASGEGDPVSTNQSAGDSFVGKNIVIDVADVFYEYDYHSFVRAGKMKLPFYRTHKNQMLWDNDLRPEGAFVKHKLFEDTDITAGAFMMRNASETESKKAVGLYTVQAIQHFEKFRVGASANIYDTLKGETPNVSYNSGSGSLSPKDLSKGNSLDSNGHYENNYHLLELFAEYKVTDNFGLGIDTIYNVGASDKNYAYNISAMYGDLKENGDFKMGYYYRYTEKDAVLGMFSDSDFMGGETDSKGHQLMAGYQLAKNTQFAVTYINGVQQMSSEPEHFQRLHLDVKFKF